MYIPVNRDWINKNWLLHNMEYYSSIKWHSIICRNHVVSEGIVLNKVRHILANAMWSFYVDVGEHLSAWWISVLEDWRFIEEAEDSHLGVIRSSFKNTVEWKWFVIIHIIAFEWQEDYQYKDMMWSWTHWLPWFDLHVIFTTWMEIS